MFRPALILLLAVTASAVVADDRGAGTLSCAGLSETRFMPAAGSFRCHVRGATLAAEDDAIAVYINDTPLNQRSIHAVDRAVRVDYRLDPGLNEVLVEARSREGRLLRADALVWSGTAELIVSVTDSRDHPVEKARITVALAEQSSVQFRGLTEGGNLYVANLPPEPVLVTAESNGRRARKVVDSAAGFVHLSLR